MRYQILNCISTIKELNVDEANRLGIGVEIQDFVEPNLSVGEKKKLISDYMIRLDSLVYPKAMHGPFLDLKPSSPDNIIRMVSQEKYKETLDIANLLEMDYVIFHSQINPYLNQPILMELNNNQAAFFWNKLLDESSYMGIIVLENIFEETPYMLKELLKTIDNDRIGINLDIGHLKLGRTSLKDWLRELKDYIKYIHVHSNDGVYDQHQPPSEQELESLMVDLEMYKIEPIISLEYKIHNLAQELLKYGIEGNK